MVKSFNNVRFFKYSLRPMTPISDIAELFYFRDKYMKPIITFESPIRFFPKRQVHIELQKAFATLDHPTSNNYY